MNSKKQARRDRAKARFSIMSFTMWSLSTRSDSRKKDDYTAEAYKAYVARKNEERIALGL